MFCGEECDGQIDGVSFLDLGSTWSRFGKFANMFFYTFLFLHQSAAPYFIGICGAFYMC